MFKKLNKEFEQIKSHQEDIYKETHFRPRDTYRLKMRGCKKIFHANENQKKAGKTILISNKIDFKITNVKRDKERHYTMTKGSVHEEDITIVNIYWPNTGTLQYIRQVLISIKGEIGSNTIVVDFNTQITPVDGSPRQKINK